MNGDTMPVFNGMPESVELLIVLGAIMLVALIAFFCALLLRNNEKRQGKHHHHRHRKSYRERVQKGAGDVKELIRQRRSRSRHESRPINPTLAQTGGLPPLRGEGNPPPPSPTP